MFAKAIQIDSIFCGCTQVPGYEQGNFIGPTILTDVRVDMECYKVSASHQAF